MTDSRVSLSVLWLALAAVTVCAHGLLVLNDGYYWDGWLIYTFARDGQWDLLERITREVGGFQTNLYLRWWLARAPVWLLHLVIFLALAVHGAAVFGAALTTRLVSPIAAFWIAAIAIVYPAYQVSVEFNSARYLIYYASLCAGVSLALMFERATGVRRTILRIGALLVFAFSFRLDSAIVFYAAGVSLMLADRYHSGIGFGHLLTQYLPRRLDFLLLPFGYWTLGYWLYPRLGTHVEYYALVFQPHYQLNDLRQFWENAIAAQWAEAFSAIASPLRLLVVGGFSVAVGSALARGTAHMREPRGTQWAVLGFGLLTLMLAVLPYVAVRRPPAATGWDTRHSLLMGLPVAILTVGVVYAVAGGQSTFWKAARYSVLTLLVMAFAAATVRYYINWQARWVKDRSILVHLGDLAAPPSESVFWIEDRFPLGGESYYRSYEWAAMFKSVWGSERYIGLDTSVYGPAYLEEGRPYFDDTHALSAFDPGGCHAQMVIDRGSEASPLQLVTEYFRYRFVSPAKMDLFLRGVTRIAVNRLPRTPPDCRPIRSPHNG